MFVFVKVNLIHLAIVALEAELCPLVVVINNLTLCS